MPRKENETIPPVQDNAPRAKSLTVEPKQIKSLHVSLFNWMWLVSTVAVASVLSFHTYPSLYNKLTGTITPLYFQITGIGGQHYYLINNVNSRNSPLYKDNLSDNSNLYYNVCNLVSPDNRNSCRDEIGWYKVDVKQLDCTDVRSCTKEFVRVPDEIRQQRISVAFTARGHAAGVENREKSSLSEPTGWGLEARWPLFFFFVYFGLKLGQLTREFVLGSPPEKS